MNTIKILTIILVSFVFHTLDAQYVFMEENNWGTKDIPILPDGIDLKYKMTPDSANVGDTILLKFLYPSKKVAIEGKCVVNSSKEKVKIGIWKHYYQNGKIWSSREYNNSGKIIAIPELKSPKGIDLPHGYGRYIGKNNQLIGYNYIYDEKGDIQYFAEYSSSTIRNKMDKMSYNDDQLKRVKIRKFNIDENNILEELSFEEAFELQKTNNKTILLNASTNWNGYTKRGFANLFTKSHIAKFIDDNFILAYMDIEDTRPFEIIENNEKMVFEGASNRKQHDLIVKLVGSINSTPTFLFIGPNLTVLHKHNGIELVEEEFIRSLEFFISKSYLSQSWKEYNK